MDGKYDISLYISLAEQEMKGKIDVDDPLYKSLNCEQNSIEICQLLLDNPNMSQNVYIFASSHLFSLLKRFCPQWSVESFNNVLNWLIGLLVRYGKSFNTVVFNKLSDCYGVVLFLGWQIAPSIQLFVKTIAEAFQDPKFGVQDIGLLFLAGVVSYISKTQDVRSPAKDQLKDNYLLEVFRIGYEVIMNEEINPTILPCALKLLTECLSFDVTQSIGRKTVTDEIISDTVNLPITWRDIVTNCDFYSHLFKLGQFFGMESLTSVLNVIYYLCCVKSSLFPSKEDQINVFMVIINGCQSVLQMNSEQNIDARMLQISKILYKERFRTEMDLTIEIPEYYSFLDGFADFTIKYIEKDSLVRNLYATVYIIKFWGLCSRRMSSEQFTVILPVFSAYLESLLALPEKDPDDNNQVLDLANGNINDSIKAISTILLFSFDPQSLYQQLLSSFEELSNAFFMHLEQGSIDDAKRFEKKLSIILLIIVCCFKYSIIQSSSNNLFEIEMISPIHYLFSRTEGDIEALANNDFSILEMSLMLFCKVLPHTVFMKKAENFESFQGKIPFMTSFDMLVFFFSRISTTLKVYSLNNSVVSVAVGALNTIFDDLHKNKKMNKNKAAANFVSFCCTQPFSFTLAKENKKSTIEFNNALARAALAIPEVLPEFFSYLDARYNLLISTETLPVLLSVLYTLTGVFEACTEKNYFDQFFYWVFPDKLRTLADLSPSLVEYPAIHTSLLKFLVSIVKPPEPKKDDNNTIIIQKIVFNQHSPNGIILFKLLSQVLVITFTRLSSISSEDASEEDYRTQMKSLESSLHLMSIIMKADYVMYGAFEYYGDDTLTQLLVSFFNLMKSIDIISLFQYPSLSRVIMQLIIALSENHIERILTLSQGFFDQLLPVLIFALQGGDRDLKEFSIEASRPITEFLVLSISEPIINAAFTRNQTFISELLFLHWEQLVNNRTSSSYKIARVMRSLFQLFPSSLNDIHERTLLSVPALSTSKFEALFTELSNEVAALPGADEVGLNKALMNLHTFSKENELTVNMFMIR